MERRGLINLGVPVDKPKHALEYTEKASCAFNLELLLLRSRSYPKQLLQLQDELVANLSIQNAEDQKEAGGDGGANDGADFAKGTESGADR